MKKNELVRKLSQNGCYIKENRTRHEWWYSPITQRHFTIPRHGAKEIPIGTIKNISKESGIKL